MHLIDLGDALRCKLAALHRGHLMQLLFAFVSLDSVVRCWTVAGVIGHLFQLLFGGHVLRSLCW